MIIWVSGKLRCMEILKEDLHPMMDGIIDYDDDDDYIRQYCEKYQQLWSEQPYRQTGTCSQ